VINYQFAFFFVNSFRKSQILLGLIPLLCSLSVAQNLHPYPMEDGGGTSECALLLEGPGRTSAYDYQMNTIRGNP